MERLEIIKCEKLVEEALRNVNKSKEAFDNATKCTETSERHVLEIIAWNYRGYAKGVAITLNAIGFMNEDMKKLNRLV